MGWEVLITSVKAIINHYKDNIKKNYGETFKVYTEATERCPLINPFQQHH
jgi:hypothetical protein